jgi:polar amino acid transport system permease protein
LVVAIYIGLTFSFRFVYWLIGLWLFRRKVPRPSLTGMVDVATAPP